MLLQARLLKQLYSVECCKLRGHELLAYHVLFSLGDIAIYLAHKRVTGIKWIAGGTGR